MRSHDGVPTVVEVPRPVGPGVRVHVVSVGICGSDQHLLAGPWKATLGHEMAGFTEDGTAVAVEPQAPCCVCAACLRLDHHQCVLGPAMVLGVGRDGGMAEQVLVPARSLVRLPSGLEARDACLVEPLALAVRAMQRARVTPGQRVAVVGCGTIGLVAVVAAQAAGATVDVIARHPHQRTVAAAFGAGLLDVDDGVDAASGPAGEYDVTVEAGGSGRALDQTVALCRTGGTVLGLGSYWESATTFDLRAMTRKELTFVSSRGYGHQGPARGVDVAAALLAARPEVAARLITHRFPLVDAPSAFVAAADRAAGAIKVVLEPGSHLP